MPQSAVLYAPPLPEVAWLVDAAGKAEPWPGRTRALLDVLADLTRQQATGLGKRGRQA